MWRVYAALLTVQVFFGLWPVAASAVFAHVSPFALIGFRTLLGAPLIFLLARPSRLPSPPDLLRLAGLAFLGVSANQLLYVQGLARAGPVNAVILMVIIPALTLGFGALLGRERPTPIRWLGIAIALAGAAILVRVERFDPGDQRLLGNLLILGNTSAYALYLVLARATVGRLGALVTVAWVFLFGAIEALPWTAGPVLATPWASLPGWTWAALGFVLLGPTLGAYALNAWALRSVDSSVVTVFVYLQPIIGASAAWLVLGDTLDRRTAAGAVVIAAGVALVTGLVGPGRWPWGRRRPAEAG